MDHIPAEIKRMIAFDLLSDDPADGGIIHIKQLRLVNKAYAIVAAEPLFSEIYLMLKSESFERMRHISTHPSYAKLVKFIRYEPDYLVEYPNLFPGVDDHYHSSRTSLPLILRPAWQSEDEGQQGEIGYQKEREECNARVTAGTEWFGPQQNVYETALQDQESIRQQDYNRGPFTEAMAQLSNLEQVILNIGHGIMEPTKALKTPFAVTDDLDLVNWTREPDGVMALRSILLGAHAAGTKLKVLRCGKID